MLSAETYAANYWHDDFDGRYYYHARSTNVCKTDALIREYHELDTMDCGDEEAIYRRMNAIRKELKRRGVEI